MRVQCRDGAVEIAGSIAIKRGDVCKGVGRTLYCQTTRYNAETVRTQTNGNYLVYDGRITAKSYTHSYTPNYVTLAAKLVSSSSNAPYRVELTISSDSGRILDSRSKSISRIGDMASAKYFSGSYSYSVYCRVE